MNVARVVFWAAGSVGCVNEYHPEYHPVSVVSVNQEGLAPSERQEGLAPSERQEGLAPSERQAGAVEHEHVAASESSDHAPHVDSPPPLEVTAANVASDDPLHGQFTLADATRGLPTGDALTVTLDTNEPGTHLTCKLLPDKAPLTVANFVGLARGLRPWKDSTGHWVTKPAYDHTPLHWVFPQGYIHGGDVNGGSGDAGYVLPDENLGAHHDHSGQLCMANRGPNTNSAQFFITTHAASHLDGGYTIFGECDSVTAVQQWLRMDSNVEIEKATIRRSAWEAP